MTPAKRKQLLLVGVTLGVTKKGQSNGTFVGKMFHINYFFFITFFS